MCEVVAMALEFSLSAVAFYDFFYEANCESLSCSLEKMCYIQLQRPQNVETHVFKPIFYLFFNRCMFLIGSLIVKILEHEVVI